MLADEVEHLGQEVEAHHPEQDPGRESQDEVQAVAELQREEAARAGGQEADQREPESVQGDGRIRQALQTSNAEAPTPRHYNPAVRPSRIWP